MLEKTLCKKGDKLFHVRVTSHRSILFSRFHLPISEVLFRDLIGHIDVALKYDSTKIHTNKGKGLLIFITTHILMYEGSTNTDLIDFSKTFFTV